MTNARLFGKDVNLQPANQINITETKVTISNLHLSTFENPTLSDNVHIEVKAENVAEENCNNELDEKDKELASLKLMQLIFEKIPYANIITDGKGKILEVNSAAIKMFGYSREEITSIKTLYLFEITEEVYENSLNERRLLRTLSRVRTGRTKDGKRFPCEISSVIFITNEGEERAITTIIDISERVEKQNILDTNQILNTVENTIKEKLKVERLLEENNERIKHIFNSSSDVLYDFNLLTNTVSVSDGFEKKFGYKITNNMTDVHYWLSHIYPDDRDSVVNDFNAVLASHENKWVKQYRFLRADGSAADVVSSSTIMRHNDGKAYRMIGSMKDITDKKLSELERGKITSELLRRNKELEQFTYIVSHNLRSPVANIMGLAEALTDESYPQVLHKEFLTQLNLSVLKLDDVIRDLNYTLQIKHNADEVKEAVCFNDIVKDIKISIKDVIEKHKVSIETNFDEADKFMTVKSYIYSVFFNLISNSIKYRQPGLLPIISLKSLKTAEGIQLIISDNGLGIDLDKNSGSVFGLYKRFHSHIDGKGMGLFLVKTEIEKLGGTIGVISKVNHGTTFKIFLPSTNL